MHRLLLLAALLVSVGGLLWPVPVARSNAPPVLLATTTITADTGILDQVVPLFEQRTGHQVTPLAVGVGQALRLGERGEADVVLVHSPELEQHFMNAAHGVDRKLVMASDYLLLGPAADPARITSAASPADALQQIAAIGAPFVSRGDNSDTLQRELRLWRAAGIDPRDAAWYQQVGQGAGPTLMHANQQQAYVLTDRRSFLDHRATLHLQPLVSGHLSLLIPYHVLVVNPNKGEHINQVGAQALAEFLTSQEVQDLVASFGTDRYGQPVFWPASQVPADVELMAPG